MPKRQFAGGLACGRAWGRTAATTARRHYSAPAATRTAYPARDSGRRDERLAPRVTPGSREALRRRFTFRIGRGLGRNHSGSHERAAEGISGNQNLQRQIMSFLICRNGSTPHMCTLPGATRSRRPRFLPWSRVRKNQPARFGRPAPSQKNINRVFDIRIAIGDERGLASRRFFERLRQRREGHGYWRGLPPGRRTRDWLENTGFDLVISHFWFSGLDTFAACRLGHVAEARILQPVRVRRPGGRPRPISVAFPTLSKPFEESPRRSPRSSPIAIRMSNTRLMFSGKARAAPTAPAGFPTRTWKETRPSRARRAWEGTQCWGVDPFLQYQKTHNLPLQILVSTDPFLQRVMTATVVTTKATPDANVNGAVALRDYLVSPAAQGAHPRLPLIPGWINAVLVGRRGRIMTPCRVAAVRPHPCRRPVLRQTCVSASALRRNEAGPVTFSSGSGRRFSLLLHFTPLRPGSGAPLVLTTLCAGRRG